MKPQIRISEDAWELTREAAFDFARRAEEAVHAKDLFTVALSGGSTPKGLYSLLAEQTWRAELPWSKTHFFWGDERNVPPDHADSNYQMAYTAMLSKVPVPSANVHRVRTEETDVNKAAEYYEEELRSFFQLAPGELPRFDLVLLGLGADGHTASLFPGTDALGERQRLVIANWVPKFSAYRVTMTLPVFNNAASVIFLVSGAEKSKALYAVLKGDAAPEQFPAQLIHPTDGELLWLTDMSAAADFLLIAQR